MAKLTDKELLPKFMQNHGTKPSQRELKSAKINAYIRPSTKQKIVRLQKVINISGPCSESDVVTTAIDKLYLEYFGKDDK